MLASNAGEGIVKRATRGGETGSAACSAANQTAVPTIAEDTTARITAAIPILRQLIPPARSCRLVGRAVRDGFHQLEARIADVTQPVSRILFQTTPEKPANRARRAGGQRREIRLAFDDPGDDVGGSLSCEQRAGR